MGGRTSVPAVYRLRVRLYTDHARFRRFDCPADKHSSCDWRWEACSFTLSAVAQALPQVCDQRLAPALRVVKTRAGPSCFLGLYMLGFCFLESDVLLLPPQARPCWASRTYSRRSRYATWKWRRTRWRVFGGHRVPSATQLRNPEPRKTNAETETVLEYFSDRSCF